MGVSTPSATPSSPMKAKTADYMEKLAESSFNRQADLDESIWRSLPFFGVSLGLAATMIGTAASDAPAISTSLYAVVTNLMLLASTGCFGWALWWFWQVVQGRDYEIPASDVLVREYAEDMTVFHEANGLIGDDLDEKVVEELRLFMIDQYSDAATANFKENARKTSARSQVLLFMLVGFVLAFMCEAVIFVHDAVTTQPPAQGASAMPPPPRSNGSPRSTPAQPSARPTVPSRPVPPRARVITEGASFSKTSPAPIIREK